MKNLMLDSGAYSAWRRGKVIDIDAYIEFIKEYGHLFQICVNLDVIGNGKESYMNWMYLRRQGIDTMPVFHIGTDEKWLEKYLRKTDYIGLGAIAGLSSKRRVKSLTNIWEKYFIDSKRLTTHKIHGMGLTAIEMVERFPWYSVDSVSPILQAGFGGIYLPRIEKGKFNFLKLDMYKVSSKSNSHQTGVSASFLNLGPTVRTIYEDYFQQLGIKYEGVNPVAKSSLMFPIDEYEEEKEEPRTLSTDYSLRVELNLKVWWEMNKLIPNKQRPLGGKLADYDGERLLVYVGSASHFRYVVKVKGDVGQLFSYFEMNKAKDVESKLLKYQRDESK